MTPSMLRGFSAELEKLAKESEGPSGAAIAAGVAGASPFVGMVGREKMIHDPHRNKNIRRFDSMRELAQKAKPGDILLVSKKRSPWKTMQAPMAASEFYHAQPVLGRKAGQGTSVSAGTANEGVYQRMKPKAFKNRLRVITSEFSELGYKDAILLRPNKPLKGEELKKFVRSNLDRARVDYDKAQGVKSWIKDVFVPKIVPANVLNKMKGVKLVKRNAVNPDTGKKELMFCRGNVCSSGPAQAYEEATKKRIVRGKKSIDMLPSDYLRSKEYKAIGARLNESKRVSALKPLAVRGALGVGLAGATYGAAKEPEIAGGVAGAVAAGEAQKRLALRRAKKKGLSEDEIKKVKKSLPNIQRSFGKYMDTEKGSKQKKIIGKYLRRAAPAKLIGGAGGYLLARGVSRALSKKTEKAPKQKRPRAPKMAS